MEDNRLIAETETRQLYEAAIDTFGSTAQVLMVMEEMSELQKELCKRSRGKDNVEAIAEEIADVEIMLGQMKVLFNCSGKVSQFHFEKTKRLRERLKKLGVTGL